MDLNFWYKAEKKESCEANSDFIPDPDPNPAPFNLRKKVRVVNDALLRAVKTLPCANCGRNYCNTAHHLKTRGSGGGDIESNLVSLCFKCHEEIHKLKEIRFIEKYPEFEAVLKAKGGYKDGDRWRYQNLGAVATIPR